MRHSLDCEFEADPLPEAEMRLTEQLERLMHLATGCLLGEKKDKLIMSGPNRELLLNCLAIVADFHQTYPLPDSVLRQLLAIVSKLHKIEWVNLEDTSKMAKPVCYFYQESLR